MSQCPWTPAPVVRAARSNRMSLERALDVAAAWARRRAGRQGPRWEAHRALERLAQAVRAA